MAVGDAVGGGRDHAALDEADEHAHGPDEDEEEERGRSGWSPRTMAERLFDSPRAAGGGGLEEDVEVLEARHRLEDWEVSSCQWEAPPQTVTPGQYIRHLSFANFRTTGTRRTQEEAVRGKFVTGGRLEGVLKNAPNLRTLAMTEYVDSSLTLPVLTELFFRGYSRPAHTFVQEDSHAASSSAPAPGQSAAALIDIAGGPSPGAHALEYVPYEPETDEEQWERRSGFVALEAWI